MKTKYTEYYVECDGCGRNLRDEKNVLVLSSPKVRDEQMKRFGWESVGRKDYCNTCKIAGGLDEQ